MDPRDTAAPIAAMRAAEGLRAPNERLFADPYAHLFSPKDGIVGGIWAQIPFFTEHVRLRTRFIDDGVRAAIAAGTELIVIIGAGFDTRALRMKEFSRSKARVVEVDHGDQLTEKQRRLQAAGHVIPGHVTYVPADLGQPGALEAALATAGVAAPSRIHWVCEGILGYLPIDAVRALAERTAAFSSAGSSFVANHYTPTWAPEALAQAFDSSPWKVTLGPSFDELHRTLLGPAVPAGGELFRFLQATL